MTTRATDIRPAPGSKPSGHWRRLLVAALMLASMVLGIGGTFCFRGHSPEPPALTLTGIDPAVVAAVDNARAGVRRSPRSGSAWGRLGMVLAAHDFAAEANLCFAQAERLEPLQPRWPYYQGVALSQGDPEAAIPKFERSVQLCDYVPDIARLRLGELFMIQGRLEEAADQFHHLLQRQDPKKGTVPLSSRGQSPFSGTNAKAHLGLARVAYRKGDLETSFRHLGLARTDPRTQKAAHLFLAEIQQRSGNPGAAEEAQRQGASLPDDPTWPDPFVEAVAQLRTGKQAALERADKRLRQGRISEAVALLQDTVRDYPDSDWAWYLLGKALNQRQDWLAAEQALRRAAQLTPEAAEIQFHRGVALFQLSQKGDSPLGALQAATACFRKATQLKPDYDVAYHNLGQCLRRQGDRAGALSAFRAALRCEPNLVEARTALAELLAKKDQQAETLGIRAMPWP
jgi:tetratricopeptide (TPR) repeat protein